MVSRCQEPTASPPLVAIVASDVYCLESHRRLHSYRKWHYYIWDQQFKGNSKMGGYVFHIGPYKGIKSAPDILVVLTYVSWKGCM